MRVPSVRPGGGCYSALRQGQQPPVSLLRDGGWVHRGYGQPCPKPSADSTPLPGSRNEGVNP